MVIMLIEKMSAAVAGCLRIGEADIRHLQSLAQLIKKLCAVEKFEHTVKEVPRQHLLVINVVDGNRAIQVLKSADWPVHAPCW